MKSKSVAAFGMMVLFLTLGAIEAQSAAAVYRLKSGGNPSVVGRVALGRADAWQQATRIWYLNPKTGRVRVYTVAEVQREDRRLPVGLSFTFEVPDSASRVNERRVTQRVEMVSYIPAHKENIGVKAVASVAVAVSKQAAARVAERPTAMLLAAPASLAASLKRPASVERTQISKPGILSQPLPENLVEAETYLVTVCLLFVPGLILALVGARFVVRYVKKRAPPNPPQPPPVSAPSAPEAAPNSQPAEFQNGIYEMSFCYAAAENGETFKVVSNLGKTPLQEGFKTILEANDYAFSLAQQPVWGKGVRLYIVPSSSKPIPSEDGRPIIWELSTPRTQTG